ncbi:MAG: ubiquitin-conjugating enzyme/RWD-like protein [Benniella sp.]|nr:MAG: ubiquitin-conjugating enzyme/RWD-like protein [Benniella sp.]
MPAADDMHQWFGTLFIHKGYYRDAVFKFQLLIPQDYPDRRPTVRFTSDMWHPLIDNQGYLALQYQFPQWRPHRDYLFHVLHFIKAAFKKCVLDTIVEKQAVNKEAYRMYRQENKIFARLAQQRAQLSITDSILYENYPANNSIRFSPLGEEQFDDLKQKMMSSVTSNGIMASSLTGDKRSETFDSIMAGLAD